MIKFRSLSLSVLLILSLGFISCINVKPVELKEVKNISVESIKDNELNLELELMISNPNNKQFLVREADLSISMGEVTLGKLNEVEEFVIPARSSNSYKVPLKIDLENVEKNARQRPYKLPDISKPGHS